ncbi:MAG: hypothetical protein HYX48_04995 [Chlamydiales bacterium]|nr:hypothetical protein [Chlamydiales bacterium]
MFQALKKEISSFSGRELLFIMSAMLCSFLIAADYAIIRPVSNSLFIFSYGSSFFPYAWLATVPLNLLVVYLYSRFLPRFGCLKMFLIIALIIGGGNLFCALFIKKISILPFIFYIWKEIYILLMFQQLWSVIHSTIDTKRAKYLYGIIFGIGGIGGALGSLVPGFLAVKFGSENLLFFSLPIYALLFYFFMQFLKRSSISGEIQKEMPVKDAFEAVRNIRSSPFLLFILLIVIFMQMSSTLIDFQFNSTLEQNILGKDLRTEYTGRILSIVNLITIGLQFVGSYLLVQFLGMRLSHFAIPALLCLNAAAFLITPAFGVISFSYVTIKSFDFSLFNIIKEMLYIPLKTDEKFRAKAFIDIFAYRSAKAFASFLILFLQFAAGTSLLSCISWGVLLLFIAWGITVIRLMERDPIKEKGL